MLGRRRHGAAHTRMAAGGVNASLGTRDPEDTPEYHFADNVREGHVVCDPRAVELLCRHAPARVRELHAWGCEFSESDDGAIDQRYFGAQSYRRTCFVGDRTGEAVRGEGGRLYNARGERFMERYSPDRLELDARDVVARAIFTELRDGHRASTRTS